MPWACGMAMVSGLAATIVWPRFSTALGWSAIGVSLIVTMGVAAMDFGHRDWLGYLPHHTWAQLATLASMVAIGTAIQWQLQPKPAQPARGKPARQAAADANDNGSTPQPAPVS